MVKNIEELNKNEIDLLFKNSKFQIYQKINGVTIYVKVAIENGQRRLVIMKKNYIQLTKIDKIISKLYKECIIYFENNINNFNPKFIYQFIFIPNDEPITKENLILNGLFCAKNNKNISFNLELWTKNCSKLNLNFNRPIIEYNTYQFISLDNLKTDCIFLLEQRDVFQLGNTLLINFKQNRERKTFKLNVGKYISSFNKTKKDLIKITYSDILNYTNDTHKFWSEVKFGFNSTNKEEKYLQLIYILYLNFINNYKNRYKDIGNSIDFLNDFYNQSKLFELNYDEITDNDILMTLKKHSFYGEFLLKQFILLFKDKKTNELEFLNSFNLELHKKIYDAIQKIIE